jgi:hypothetical protein
MPCILLDEDFNPVDRGSGGSGYVAWLNEKDAAQDYAASPAGRKAEQRELAEHRASVERDTGNRWDPLANDGHGAFVHPSQLHAA